MGSASTVGLIPHLQLHSCFYKHFGSIRRQQQQFPLLQINNNYNNSRKSARLRFSVPRKNRTSFSGVICLAAVDDDVGEKQQDSTSTSGTSSALEDRPDVVDSSQVNFGEDTESPVYNFLYPNKELLPDDKEMSLFDHLEELRERLFVSILAVGAAILGCFAFSKELIVVLEAPVKEQGVRFLQLAPGEFFFTTVKASKDLVFGCTLF